MSALRVSLMLGGAAALWTVPASAQMNMNMPGMHMPGMKMPAPKKKTAQRKSGANMVAAKKAAPPKPAGKSHASRNGSAKKPSERSAPKKAPAHSGMSDMPGMNMPAGETMQNMPGMSASEHQNMSSMPGMAMPQGQSMQDMPGMAMTSTDGEATGTNLPAGNAPAPSVPTDHAADAVYGSAAMAMGRHHLENFHGGQKIAQVMVNLAEYQFRNGRDGYEWNGQAWYGGDINRLWLRSEGDGTVGRSVDRAEVQALYSHAIGPYFNLQGGVRYDFKPNPSRVYASLGVEGLAPSFFELEGTAFISNKGELMARAEAYYDQRLSQRLILQPRVELNLAAQNSREIRVGSGLSDAELGVRLRYDIRREFSPYVGVQYRRAFGSTRTYLRDAGESAGGWEFLAGIRTWF